MIRANGIEFFYILLSVTIIRVWDYDVLYHRSRKAKQQRKQGKFDNLQLAKNCWINFSWISNKEINLSCVKVVTDNIL